jgi:pyruvate/2-oxoacid:ferredoxin oxidoreductase beta subunit
MTTKSSDSKSTEEPEGQVRVFLMAFRSVGDAIESTTLSAAEIPLTVLSGIGVSDDTTKAARDTGTQLVHSIHGTVDSVATQIATAVSKQVALVGNVVASATKGDSDA